MYWVCHQRIIFLIWGRSLLAEFEKALLMVHEDVLWLAPFIRDSQISNSKKNSTNVSHVLHSSTPSMRRPSSIDCRSCQSSSNLQAYANQSSILFDETDWSPWGNQQGTCRGIAHDSSSKHRRLLSANRYQCCYDKNRLANKQLQSCRRQTIFAQWDEIMHICRRTTSHIQSLVVKTTI